MLYIGVAMTSWLCHRLSLISSAESCDCYSELQFLLSLICHFLVVPPTLTDMAPQFDPLSKIQPGREAWRVKVRVIRLWSVPSFTSSTIPSSIEMILVDEFGGRIQASIKKTLVYKFQPLLIEGDVYELMYFNVAPNSGSFRGTRHDFWLVFQFRTKVNPTQSVLIPVNGLALIPFEDVSRTDGESDYLIDVIGQLTGVSAEKEYEREGKLTRMIVVELTDDSGKLDCAFFGEYVDSLNAFIAAGDLDQPIVIVQLAKFKTFKGKVVIQNAMHAMKLIFNPNIAEAIDLCCRLTTGNLVGSQTISFLPHGQLVSLEDDFMKLHPTKSLEQLIEVKEDGHFIVMATVKGIVEDGDLWWYVACNCGRAVTPDSGMYYCDVCFTHVFNVNPRYRVKIEVEDATVTAVLVLFDRDGQLLFKRTCVEMITEAKRGGGVANYPSVFNSLLGKKLLFKIETKSVSTSQYNGTYKVKRVCDDDTIIAMFQLPGSEKTPTKALFNPPFPKVSNLGCDESRDDSVAAEDFSSQVLDEVVCLGSVEASTNVKITPAKRKLEEAMKSAVDAPNVNVLKVVKMEKL